MPIKLRRAGMRTFVLPLVQPLSTAHGRIASRDGYLVSLMDEDGRCGFGESTPLPEFGTEDLATCGLGLKRALTRLVDGETRSVEEALDASLSSCAETPCALSAVDGALHDLAAQRAGRTLPSWIRDRAGSPGQPADRIRVQALVVGDDPASVATSARASVDAGFETFKLKLSVSPSQSDLGLDLARVEALRDVIGAKDCVRLDANEAWTFAEAEHALDALEHFDIDYVEQPVAREDLEALKDLDTNASIAVAADEALLGKRLAACLESRAASIFVVKPAALGGITPSIALFRRAMKRDIRIVWSSLIDGSVGRATATALAAALGSEGEVHGLGTANLLAEDLIAGCEVVGGGIELGDASGLGCDLAPVWEVQEDAGEEGRGEVWIIEGKN